MSSGFYSAHATFLMQQGGVYDISVIWTTDDRLPFLEAASWKNFKWHYLSNRSSDPLPVWFYGGIIGVGQFNSAIYIYALLTLVAVATEFGTKWTITPFV